KPHDNVGRERDTWPPGTQLVYQFAVFRQCIATSHSLQHIIVTVLHWNIDMWADLRQRRHVLDQLVGKVAKVRGNNSDTRTISYFGKTLQKVGKVGLLLRQIQAIGLYGLAKQS